MLDAAVKALSQILSPPMRSILWRSIGLALVLITLLAVGLQRLLSWFAESGEVWLEAMLGPGFIVFFIATAWLLGREYFELAAMRFRSPAEAKAMRKANAATVFIAGLVIAAFVSIPIVNLATPLFGMAFMVHMHKRLSGPRPELIEPTRRTGVPTV